jgi:hypothetical protein
MATGDRRIPKYFSWGGTERRTGTDRRTVSQRRITLSQGYGRGWLTFESLEEKRRLIPIPSHWEDCSQAELRALCDKAKSVPKSDESKSA